MQVGCSTICRATEARRLISNEEAPRRLQARPVPSIAPAAFSSNRQSDTIRVAPFARPIAPPFEFEAVFMAKGRTRRWSRHRGCARHHHCRPAGIRPEVAPCQVGSAGHADGALAASGLVFGEPAVQDGEARTGGELDRPLALMEFESLDGGARAGTVGEKLAPAEPGGDMGNSGLARGSNGQVVGVARSKGP